MERLSFKVIQRRENGSWIYKWIHIRNKVIKFLMLKNPVTSKIKPRRTGLIKYHIDAGNKDCYQNALQSFIYEDKSYRRSVKSIVKRGHCVYCRLFTGISTLFRTFALVKFYMDYGKLNSASQWEQYLLSEVCDSLGFQSEAWPINT